jgi:hypothetical protein
LTYKTLLHIVESMKNKFLSTKARHLAATKKKEADLLNAFCNPKKVAKIA